MAIKKYSDFDHSVEKTTLTTADSSLYIKPDATLKFSDNGELTINKSIKEEVLLAPKDANIEILEDKIIKFNNGHIKDILETIKTKYSDTDYYIRKKDNELHIVKYNETLKLNVNEFVNVLLKYYSSKVDSNKITEGIRVKGNNNFSIIENMKTQYTDKFVNDLTNLLAKKNK